MIEVEIKLPVESIDAEIIKLKALGFATGEAVIETDRYFDSMLRPIAAAGEALRIREEVWSNGKTTVIATFKGKKMDNISMSRQEAEAKVESAEDFEHFLNAMGMFHVKPEVKKERQYLHRGHITACADRVHNLGDFLELEILTEENKKEENKKEENKKEENKKEENKKEENKKEEALKEIEELLGKLGYHIEDTVTNSYLSMLRGEQD